MSAPHIIANRRNGLMPRWPDHLTAKLRRLHHSGLSRSQMANALGLTRSAVIAKCSRLGLRRRA